MVARWILLLLACLLWCGLLGVNDPQMPAALQWLVATAGVALLAPLFWPGHHGTAASAALRVTGWTAAAVIAAVLAVMLVGTGASRLPMVLPASAMLAGLLVVSLAMVAWLESRWRQQGADACGAREQAGRSVALSLFCLGATPVWCGPAAELLLARHAWAVDAAIGVSPLTHLAVAVGNDVLRNDWLYRHSNLAALQFDYPAPALLAVVYTVLGSGLAAAALVMSYRRNSAPALSIANPSEKSE